MIDQVAALIGQMRWQRDDIAQFLGSYLSEPKPHVFFDAPARAVSRAKFQVAASKRGVHLALQSQMLFCGAHLFINGEQVRVTGTVRRSLIDLADRRALSGPLDLADAAWALLYDWYQAGYIALGSTPK